MDKFKKFCKDHKDELLVGITSISLGVTYVALLAVKAANGQHVQSVEYFGDNPEDVFIKVHQQNGLTQDWAFTGK